MKQTTDSEILFIKEINTIANTRFRLSNVSTGSSDTHADSTKTSPLRIINISKGVLSHKNIQEILNHQAIQSQACQHGYLGIIECSIRKYLVICT
jgi:hypothetical protein